MTDADIIITQYGASITYTTVTQASISARGDRTETTADATVTAFVQPLTGQEDILKEGELQIGDALAFFKSNATVNIGDRVTHQSKVYKIVSIIKPEQSATIEFIEARLKRYIAP